jgi:hypothetical protein
MKDDVKMVGRCWQQGNNYKWFLFILKSENG